MTKPIQQKSRSDIEQFYEAAEATTDAVLFNDVKVKGPTAKQARVEEQVAVERGQVSQQVTKAVRAHGEVHGVAHVLRALGTLGAKAALVLTWGHLAHEVFGAISGSPALGKEDRAKVRDAMHLATLRLTEGVLSQGFVQEQRQKLEPRPGFADVLLAEMNRRVDRDAASPEAAERTKRGFVAAAERAAIDGMEVAAGFDLRDEGKLKALLAKEPALRARYHDDPAFRAGLDDMVSLARRNPATHEARRQVFARQQASSPEDLANALRKLR